VLKKCLFAAFLVIPTLAGIGRAEAAPEEIQVYEDDMDKPGQFGLDVHNNYVFGPSSPVQYPGEAQPDDRYRLTPEFSYGLAPDFELGLYLPLATYNADGSLDAGGAKVRIKYIAPKPSSQDWYWGLNFEVGYQDHELDINPWNAELKGILGWRKGPWDVAFNLNIDAALAGPQVSTPTVQLATKVDYKVTDNLALGVESYDGAGDLTHLGTFGGAGHSIFATADTHFGLWNLNVGIGRGFSGDPDQWIFKFIVSVPIDN
jgi:hypothetical protein